MIRVCCPLVAKLPLLTGRDVGVAILMSPQALRNKGTKKDEMKNARALRAKLKSSSW